MKSKFDINWDAFQEKFEDFLGHVEINSKDEGRIPFEAYDAQRYAMDEVFRGLRDDIHFFVIGKARQLGITTLFELFDVFYCGAVPDMQGSIVFQDEPTRDAHRFKLNEMLDTLPPTHQLRLAKGGNNRNGLRFENGNAVDYLIAGTKKGTKSIGVGRAYNHCHASEVALYGDEEAFEQFRQTFTEIYPFRFYVFESTGRGHNLFYHLFEEALADEITKRAIFVTWWRKRTYSYRRGTALYKRYGWPELAPEEREASDKVMEDYGHKISLEQWAWYRHMADPRSEEGAESEASEKVEVLHAEYPHCVIGPTRVGSENGIIRIADAYEGLRATKGAVIGTGVTGRADVFRLTTKMGYSFVGTGNHPVGLTDGSFCDLRDSLGKIAILCPPLTASAEYVVSWREPPAICRVDITEEFATFLGLYMGDGSYHDGTLSIVFNAQDIDVIHLYVRMAERLFGTTPTLRHVGDKLGGVEARFRRRHLLRSFDALGLIGRYNCGKVKRLVHVPDYIFRSPREVIRGFLRGLFDADGYVGRDGNRMALAGKSKEFLRDVQLLLLAFGVTCQLCKRHSTKDKIVFDCHTLELRALQTDAFFEQIGFLSARKLARRRIDRVSHPHTKPMELQDEIISIELHAKDQPVWNMTIAGNENVFDAGGVLTHNTPDMCWRETGSPFIPGKYLTDALARAAKLAFKAYRYYLGDNVLATRIDQTNLLNRAQLRVWQEPVPNGVYVVSCDPAYGLSDDGDGFAIQVVRCYADRIVQVAEFCDRNIQPYQCAWVMLHLCAWYGNCRYILELNGPGAAVWTEFRNLKRAAEDGQLAPARANPANPTPEELERESGIRNAYGLVRQYLYHRADSLGGGGYNYQMVTSERVKFTFMLQMADRLMLGELDINSVPCLKEIQEMRKDGLHIGAQGRGKDDRPLALGLAVHAYIDSERRALVAENRTFANEQAIAASTGNSMVATYMSSIVANHVRSRQQARRRSQRSIGWRW